MGRLPFPLVHGPALAAFMPVLGRGVSPTSVLCDLNDSGSCRQQQLTSAWGCLARPVVWARNRAGVWLRELAAFALDHVLGPVPQLLPLLRMRVACELAGWLATANICCYMCAALTFACGDTGGQAVHVVVIKH